jgi:hypothetical protein
MKKRITRTVVETHEVIRMTTEEQPLLGHCPACGRESVFVRPEAAARETGISQREIFRQIEAGKIHHLERPDGGVLVCLASAVEPETELNQRKQPSGELP